MQFIHAKAAIKNGLFTLFVSSTSIIAIVRKSAAGPARAATTLPIVADTRIGKTTASATVAVTSTTWKILPIVKDVALVDEIRFAYLHLLETFRLPIQLWSGWENGIISKFLRIRKTINNTSLSSTTFPAAANASFASLASSIVTKANPLDRPVSRSS